MSGETWRQVHAIPTFVTPSRESKPRTPGSDNGAVETLGAKMFGFHPPQLERRKASLTQSAYERVAEEERVQRLAKEKAHRRTPTSLRPARPVSHSADFFSPPGMGDDFSKPVARRITSTRPK